MAINTNVNNLNTRYLTIKLILDNGIFPDSTTNGVGSNTKIITANSGSGYLACEVVVNKMIGFLSNEAYITIYGMNLQDINTFSRANIQNPFTLYVANRVEIYAGYSLQANGLPALLYSGQVLTAAPDFNGNNRKFNIHSLIAGVTQNGFSLPTNPTGTVALNDLFQNMINRFPNTLAYKPNNVTGVAVNPLYEGSALQQLQQATSDYGYQMMLDNNTVYISPKDTPFNTATYILSGDNGMLGYPILEDMGLSVRMRYDPAVSIGSQIKLISLMDIVKQSKDNIWWVNAMQIFLQNKESKWETVLKLNPFYFIPS